ncbi:hypothetical protein [Fluviicola chungangensis]|uniref:Uncharacterized protein n=1 Tax=Fluviicola chungangensis TaxID=2597671 RepID=A0A556MPV6_9FLAO|nr:hypothetical protein [Fluviicola chungangensis]TSJ41984.1 hypothetical protein FO442_12905 [Fluviicola chungangensis]
MHFLKKLDIFLLEKFPLLWHTKLPYAACFSIIISALFYVWGYIFTTEFLINRFPESSYFERSNALLCFLIINAIFIIVWALAFYRKSAVKNLYPLQRFYFTRLLCSFLFIFWSLTWSFTTFNWGVKSKIRNLAPLTELEEHIRTINFADAFLFNNSFTYDTYIQTFHPDVSKIRFDYNDSVWKDVPTILCRDTVQFNSTESKYVKKMHPLEIKETTYHPSEHPWNNDTVENKLVQFLLTQSRVTKIDCYGTNETLYLIGAKKLNQLCPNGLNDLRNFCKEKISPSYFEYEKYDNIFLEYAARRFHFRGWYYRDDNFSIKINKDFNDFLSQSSQADVLQLLNKYERLLNRHQIGYSLNTSEILDYVWKRKHNMNFSPIVGQSSNNPKQVELDRARFGNLENYEAYKSQTDDVYEQPWYFVETGQLEQLYSNSLRAHDPAINWMAFIVSIFFALGCALVFFLFAIGNPINLIIVASAGGVFVILNILFFVVFLEYHGSDYGTYKNTEFRLFSQLMVFSAILYALFYIFYQGKNVSKRLLLITFNLCFALSVLFPAFLFLFLESVLKTEYLDSCSDSHTIHSLFYYWVQDPIVIWVSAFSAILLFTHFIKPVLAKPE